MEPLLKIAVDAARAAAKIVLKNYGRIGAKQIQHKENNEVVTQIDRDSEEIIISYIRRFYPEHNILSEEKGLDKVSDSDWLWIIDPLDGTHNFSRGLPFFTVAIACQHKQRIKHAVIIDPLRNDEFTASQGQGARLNDTRRLRVINDSSGGPILAIGMPGRSRQVSAERYLKYLERVLPSCGATRRSGCTTLDLAYIAAGRLDGFIDMGTKPWDIAAGSLLIEESGGIITDFEGRNNYLENGNVVAGNLTYQVKLQGLVRNAD